MRFAQLLTGAIAAIVLSSCDKYGNIIFPPHGGAHIDYPAVAEAADPKILATANGINLYNGGYGSSMAQDPTDPSVFYLLTDRGPNVAGALPIV